MLSNIELSTFCQQLGMLVHSGISVMEGISIIKDDVADLGAQKLLTYIYEGLELGQEFSEVLRETKEFPKYATDMIRIGNYSGKLDEVLHALAIYYEREESIAAGIKSALTYPVIMILMLFIVVGVLIVNVLPVFQDVYRQLGTQLTGPAAVLMSFSTLLQNILPQLIIGLIVVGLLFLFLCRKKSGLLSHFFLSKKITLAIATGRFANGMALTLSSGLDTDESLLMTAELTDYPLVQTKIKMAQGQIADGARFADAITAAGIFNHAQSRMLVIGSRSGTMEQVMEDISRQCNEETDAKLQRLLAILEPTLVAALAVIVGVILLSVMLPLMGIMTNIGM